MKKSPGGSGSGNKGVAVIDGARPSCVTCGGFLKSNGTKRWKCTDCGDEFVKNSDRGALAKSAVNKFEASYGFDLDRAAEHARRCEAGQRLLVTSAQNNSDPFDPMYESLRHAATFYNCPLAIMPSHYRNISTWSQEDEKWFAPKLQNHLVHTDLTFGNVILRPDARIRPTTLNPLAGKQGHSGRHWMVFGHPQLARQPIATIGAAMPKVMFTTGSVTLPNYSLTDPGYKAEFHHCQAALILEKYEGVVYVRQLSADHKGHIHDLDVRFTPNGYTTGHKVEALSFGDSHVKFNVLGDETFGKGGLVDLLKPKWLIHNDVMDGFAGSHHHDKEPVLQFMKHHKVDNDYRAEVEQAIDFLNKTTPSYSTCVLVPSNHHDHLDQFLARANANTDHTNSLFISEMQAATRKAALAGERHDAFYLYAKDRLTGKTKWLDRNTSFKIDDVELSQHGDKGANGSRGSPMGFAKLPDKMTTAHIHQAIIHLGVFTVGKSTDRLGYENGPSSHSISHVVQYKGGKRATLDLMNGRYYAPRPRKRRR